MDGPKGLVRTLLAVSVFGITIATSMIGQAADPATPATATTTTATTPPPPATPVVDENKEPITPRVELRYNLTLDLIGTGALAVTTVVWRLLRDDLEPNHCRWCDGSREGSGEVNGLDDWFRRGLKRPDTYPANLTSYILAFGAVPLAGAGLTALAAVADNRGDEAAQDILFVAEGGFTAMLLTEVLEPIALRTRPYVHSMANDDVRNAEIAKTGAFHSFPAGHVVEAFGVASAAGVVASMRGYRLAPLVWVAGILLGTATAYTRIASDRHYFTDTLAGAAIGTVAGGAVPLLFHRPKAASDVGSAASLLNNAHFVALPLPNGGHMMSLGASF
jgi:membrane-associated phospholipid phosphatase